MKKNKPNCPEDSLAFALIESVKVVTFVLEEGRSLTDALELADIPPIAKGAVQDISYTAMRTWGRAYALKSLLAGHKRLNPLDLDVLLTVTLCLALEADRVRYEPHTLVDQAVSAAAAQRHTAGGKNLINACLRRYFREIDELVAELDQDPRWIWSFPGWWINKVRKQYPDRWEQLLAHANQQPPLTLRVNRRRASQAEALAACEVAGMEAVAVGQWGLWLPKPVPVSRIPGFAEGWVSVQDAGAQQAATLLELKDGLRVLDACCAPGGKTGHLLEIADVELTALDADPERLSRVEDNLSRLGLLSDRVQMVCDDASQPKRWWDGRPYDLILADVPCSASGVVRRHPDIRWLRRENDVANLSHLQGKIVDGLWSLLKPGGTLLIVTCSIFEEEGGLLVRNFLKRHKHVIVEDAPGLVFPEMTADGPGQDGFFYAKLKKAAHG